MIQNIIRYLKQDIWRVRARKVAGVKGAGIRALRILFVSVREFVTDQCVLRASALTFFSLLSIVPVFAMAFGLAKGFGMDKMLRQKLLENMESQQEVVTRIIQFSENLLQNTQGGIIAGIGLIFLFWTVIKVLGNIESSFNDIWGIKKQRTLGRKFTDYLSLMLIAPVIFLIGSSATVFIISQVTVITAKVAILGFIGPVILTALKILPYAVFWGLLTYLYMFMPNAKINFKSALIGGIVAGTVYQIVQWGYIHFQVGVAKAGAIYGSFAALPLFLMWLQISWLIVLYGAELAFAHQNEETFEFEPDCLHISERMKKTVALRVTHLCIDRFRKGLPPQTADQMQEELEIPIRLLREILYRLSEAGVLMRTATEDDKNPAYQPARHIDDLTFKNVLDCLERSGVNELPFGHSPELARIEAALETFGEAVSQSPANLALKEI